MSTGKQPRQYNLLFFQHWGGGICFSCKLFPLTTEPSKGKTGRRGEGGSVVPWRSNNFTQLQESWARILHTAEDDSPGVAWNPGEFLNGFRFWILNFHISSFLESDQPQSAPLKVLSGSPSHLSSHISFLLPVNNRVALVHDSAYYASLFAAEVPWEGQTDWTT